MLTRRSLIATSAALAAGRTAFAQDAWPSRNVTIVVPFAPGSSSDIIGRLLAQNLQQSLGKPFVVENRPGATGEVGTRTVIRAAPDGHTLMHAPLSVWAINVALRPDLPYDPVRQLTRITQTVRTPNVLVVHPGTIEATNLAGTVDWLKRNAANAAYSSSGIGSSDHLTAEMFKQVTGTDVTHVPFSGGGPATTALISGTVQMSFQNLGSIQPHIEAGRVRPILITSRERSPLLPNVPTAIEAGLADFVVYSWQAFGGPPGIPAPLLQRIHEHAVAALRAPDSVRRLSELGFDVVANTPDELAAFQAEEIARWRRVVQAGNIRPE